MLRKANIEDFDSKTMAQPAPRIVLGSMALRSLYFAADSLGKVSGLANKLNSTQQEAYFLNDVNKCDAVPECVGQQIYDYSSNSCQEPDCYDYFFVELDPSTHECVYRQDMIKRRRGNRVSLRCFRSHGLPGTAVQLFTDHGIR